MTPFRSAGRFCFKWWIDVANNLHMLPSHLSPRKRYVHRTDGDQINIFRLLTGREIARGGASWASTPPLLIFKSDVRHYNVIVSTCSSSNFESAPASLLLCILCWDECNTIIVVPSTFPLKSDVHRRGIVFLQSAQVLCALLHCRKARTMKGFMHCGVARKPTNCFQPTFTVDHIVFNEALLFLTGKKKSWGTMKWLLSKSWK